MKAKITRIVMATATLGLPIQAGAQTNPAWVRTMHAPTMKLPGCAPLTWMLNERDGTLVGVIWFTDGTGYSAAKGTIDRKAGTFHIDIEPVEGNSSPQGSISGTQKADGTITADIAGGRCANMQMVFKPGDTTATPEQ